MTIHKILLPAVRATWRTKWSWIIALFTLTPLTIQNEWKMVVDLSNAAKNPREYFWLFSDFRGESFSFQDFFNTATNAPVSMILFIVSLLLLITLSLFLAWIIVNAQGIIVLLHHPERALATTSLSKVLGRIGKLWIPLLELNIGMLAARLLGVSLLLLLFSLVSSAAGSIVGWILLVPMLIVLAILSFTIRFSIFKVLLEKKDVMTSLKESFALFKKNALACIEFSFMLYLITVAGIFFIITLLLSIISPVELGESILAILFLDAGILPFIITFGLLAVIIFVSGWLTLFNYAAWLTWYSEVSEKKFEHSYLKKIYSLARSYVK